MANALLLEEHLGPFLAFEVVGSPRRPFMGKIWAGAPVHHVVEQVTGPVFEHVGTGRGRPASADAKFFKISWCPKTYSRAPFERHFVRVGGLVCTPFSPYQPATASYRGRERTTWAGMWDL